MSHGAIDAVIMWVDGADPVLAEKRRQYLADPGLPGAAATRFASSDEVIWCTLSILRFAPFFRRIFFVTDNQTPPVFDAVQHHFPDQAHKMSVVDHREIFAGYEEFLPAFNSSTISQMLHRIPGLADRFVYFNDDFFLMRPTTPEDYFAGDTPVLRGDWAGRKLRRKLRVKQFLRATPLGRYMKNPLSSIPRQIASAAAVGCDRPFVAAHAPYPIRRAVMEEFERTQPQAFRKNLGYRFRHPAQPVPEALANHLEIKAGNFAFPPEGASATHVYIDLSRNSLARIRRRLARVEQDSSRKFLCVQSMDFDNPERHKLVRDWLDNWIVAPIHSDPAKVNGTDERS
ncbi:MAG TPA: capsular biosynthesis protein [Aliiroseovarius sp.]|nr:capsular biosynthesis protein [Aliiroseovarius sp.]